MLGCRRRICQEDVGIHQAGRVVGFVHLADGVELRLQDGVLEGMRCLEGLRLRRIDKLVTLVVKVAIVYQCLLVIYFLRQVLSATETVTLLTDHR